MEWPEVLRTAAIVYLVGRDLFHLRRGSLEARINVVESNQRRIFKRTEALENWRQDLAEGGLAEMVEREGIVIMGKMMEAISNRLTMHESRADALMRDHIGQALVRMEASNKASRESFEAQAKELLAVMKANAGKPAVHP